MVKKYTDEQNAQVILALLKEHRIKKIIASPGTTNMALVVSMQNDPYFEMYSSTDERSAAYLACGLAAESGEPVVLSCTGATASQNYIPGLTEAYYRKLPVLAITSSKSTAKVGHHIAQVTDRGVLPRDMARLSVSLPLVKDGDDLWECEIKVNQAILELKRHGGGPAHINLPTTYSRKFDVSELPKYRVIDRIFPHDNFPELPSGKVGIFVGAHVPMSKELTEAIDRFCASNNGVVFCDHSSNYKGRYRVLFAVAAAQANFERASFKPNTFIYIGEITGDYYTPNVKGSKVWRVSEDGQIRDTFNGLRYVFEMPEISFFQKYSIDGKERNNYLAECKAELSTLYERLPELPFSNIWLASQLAHKLPQKSVLHLGILNSLRAWNFFEIPANVDSFSNVGGFGIDGNVSTLVGASLADKNRLYFGVIGDLAFFYDMNVVGNRHLGNNLRLIIVNNGLGTEFRNSPHRASIMDDNDADKFVAARGHFGNQSPNLLKHYSEDLGFEYISASDKEGFDLVYERFLTPEITNKSMVFEVFTNSSDETKALEVVMNLRAAGVKKLAKKVVGKSGRKALKKVLGR